MVISNQGGSSNQSGSVNLKIDLQLPASFLGLNGCSGGMQGDLKDFFEGLGEQLLVDLVGVPVSTVIELTANMPGLSLHTRNVLMSHAMDRAHYDMKYWTGSDAYRVGRQVGHRISVGIGTILTAVGIVDMISAFTIAVPTAAAGAACEVASGGACTPVAAAVWAVDVVAVGVGVSLAAYGGMILYATTKPVAGSEPVVTRHNYREVYKKLHPKMPNDYRVHHRIPQAFRDLFGEKVIDRVRNLVGVSPEIHNEITTAWEAWRAARPNPTIEQVLEYERYIESVYGKYFWIE